MSVEVGIEGLVDDPHTAAPKLLQDLIVREGLAFHRTPFGGVMGYRNAGLVQVASWPLTGARGATKNRVQV